MSLILSRRIQLILNWLQYYLSFSHRRRRRRRSLASRFWLKRHKYSYNKPNEKVSFRQSRFEYKSSHFVFIFNFDAVFQKDILFYSLSLSHFLNRLNFPLWIFPFMFCAYVCICVCVEILNGFYKVSFSTIPFSMYRDTDLNGINRAFSLLQTKRFIFFLF